MSYIRSGSRVWSRQWLWVFLLFSAYVLAYMDRSALSIATPEVRRVFALNLSEMGLLLSVFPWVYGISQLVAGPVVDRVGPRFLAGMGLAIWSLVQAAAGLVGSAFQLFWARVALGAAESPLSPCTIRVLRSWFRHEDRGLAISICFSGASLGPAIAPPLLTWLMLRWGWRAMFVTVGVLGIFLAVVWWSFYRETSQYSFSAAERDELPVEETPLSTSLSFKEWLRLFRFASFWGMVLGNFGLVYLAWIYITWLPGLLEIERHMSVLRTGYYAGIPQFAGLFGFWSSGWVGDRLLRAGFSPMACRKIPMVVGLIGMATATVPAALIHNNNISITFIAIAVFLGSASQPAQWALVTVVAPPRQVSTFGGLTNFGGAMGGALSAVVTGYIAQRTGSFVWALILGGVISVGAALSYGLMVQRPITSEEWQPPAFATAASSSGGSNR